MRISTTTLESFRLFCDPEQDWMSEADLIATIKGEFVPTPAVELGKAFGLILETPDTYRVPGGYRCNGYSFDDATLREPLLRIDRRGVFEAKAVKAYGPHDVVAKADHLLGAHLSEFKTTLSTFNFEKYAASCQWRFMADLFEPTRITYHVFSLDDHGNTVVTLRGIDSFDLYPYADLHADCCDLVDRFVTYVRAKGLESVLQSRQASATWAA